MKPNRSTIMYRLLCIALLFSYSVYGMQFESGNVKNYNEGTVSVTGGNVRVGPRAGVRGIYAQNADITLDDAHVKKIALYQRSLKGFNSQIDDITALSGSLYLDHCIGKDFDNIQGDVKLYNSRVKSLVIDNRNIDTTRLLRQQGYSLFAKYCGLLDVTINNSEGIGSSVTIEDTTGPVEIYFHGGKGNVVYTNNAYDVFADAQIKEIEK